MIQKIKKFIVVGIIGLTMTAPSLVPALAGVAAADNISSGLCTGTTSATGGSEGACTTTTGNDSLKTLAKSAINIFSIVVGIVAVIMIILGGFRYITSGGDSGNVSGAKNTLIYAIVGLIIVALAQFIVHYVLSVANGTGLNA